jgi:glyoxylase-like metal-dependent hydrolase (beta-lactamase superfamily II)
VGAANGVGRDDFDLIFGENDAVLVDTLTTADEAEALARWIELHHRNLSTIYVTHMHIDHYGGLSVLQRHFPDARAIATPKSVELMPKQPEELAVYRKFLPGLPTAITVPEPYDKDVSPSRARSCTSSSRGRPTLTPAPRSTFRRSTSSSAATCSITSAT